MEADAIVSLISSVGFPIVCCGALFWYVNHTMKNFMDEVKTSLSSLSKTISDNTDATNKLVTTVELLLKIGGENK